MGLSIDGDRNPPATDSAEVGATGAQTNTPKGSLARYLLSTCVHLQHRFSSQECCRVLQQWWEGGWNGQFTFASAVPLAVFSVACLFLTNWWHSGAGGKKSATTGWRVADEIEGVLRGRFHYPRENNGARGPWT